MAAIERLLAIMDRLRDPYAGCPWDREQSFRSIVPHTIEEAYEVADAIEQEDFKALPAELGDLLFQVVFYARMGKEKGWFSFDTVVDAIADKLVERHPHVFAGEAAASAEQQSLNWERMKADQRREDGQHGVLDGVALTLPALARAAKLQRRASRVGFDWPSLDPVIDKVKEELREVCLARAESPERTESELGDLLFACVNLARHLEVDPEQALRGANRRFERRFRYIERRLGSEGKDLGATPLDVMDALWEEAKRDG